MIFAGSELEIHGHLLEAGVSRADLVFSGFDLAQCETAIAPGHDDGIALLVKVVYRYLGAGDGLAGGILRLAVNGAQRRLGRGNRRQRQ